jgi:hypothetical protein
MTPLASASRRAWSLDPLPSSATDRDLVARLARQTDSGDLALAGLQWSAAFDTMIHAL